jgi:signal transduction histidine kinase
MRRQLALLSLAVTSLVIIALVVPLGLAIRSLPRDRALSEAVVLGRTLGQSIAAIRTSDQVESVLDQAAASGDPITVWMPDGTVLGDAAPRSQAAEVAFAGQPINARTADGTEVLTPVVLRDGTAVVRVLVSDDVATRGVQRGLSMLGLLSLLMLSIALLVSDRLARSIVRPVRSLADTTRALSSGDLAARVTPAGPPEVAEVGYRLNGLAGRIGELLVTEREAVADLSHRLRTPITALRLDAERLDNPDDAKRLLTDVEALSQALDEVIRTARQPTDHAATSCDALQVVRSRVLFWSVLAEDQERLVHASVPSGSAWVGLAGEEFGAAVDVLIENVFTHTEPGVGWAIRVALAKGWMTLEVDDDGKGGADESTLRRGVSGVGSTGLGTSIAARTAQRCGGSFSMLQSPSGGTRTQFQAPLISPLAS